MQMRTERHRFNAFLRKITNIINDRQCLIVCSLKIRPFVQIVSLSIASFSMMTSLVGYYYPDL